MSLRILTAAVLIPLVLVTVIYSPFWLFLVLIDILIFLSIQEFKKLSGKLGNNTYIPTYLLSLGFPWIWFFCPECIVPSMLFFFIVTVFWCLFTIKDLKSGLSHTGANLFVFPYIALPLTLLSEFQGNAPSNKAGVAGSMELILVLIIIWTSDSAAYFIGRKFGKHKITPRISPNKSLEGFIAGIVFPALAAPWIGRLLSIEYPWYFLVGAGIVVALMGIIGDLFESMLKRGAGIKDTSNLIPGHGGILDRIDSLLLAFPAYYLMTTIPV